MRHVVRVAQGAVATVIGAGTLLGVAVYGLVVAAWAAFCVWVVWTVLVAPFVDALS